MPKKNSKANQQALKSPASATSGLNSPLQDQQSDSMLRSREGTGRGGSKMVEDEDLLLEEQRINSHGDFANGKEIQDGEATQGEGLTEKDKKAMVILIILYLLQGIPTGLAFGSLPFLLSSQVSYSQQAYFSLCTYPYSLKLLWSPIVDSFFFKRIGRRKSWIIPVQALMGLFMWYGAKHVQRMMYSETPDVKGLTWLIFVLMFLSATQDIAVDGWALNLLSQPNLSYASTAQTIGLNTGYFLSFTVFLAFNSLEFSNKYFRSTPLEYPILQLPGYFTFWAYGFWAVTAFLVFFQKEDPPNLDDPEMDMKRVYSIMYELCSMKHVQLLLLLHLISKLGMAANEGVTSLKFLEKGLKKEDLALAVLVDFPFQIALGFLVGKWSRAQGSALRPWILANWARLGGAVVAMLIVASIPSGGNIGFVFFATIIFFTVGLGFAGTVSFVGISAFHSQIADPVIGGTYMTLLNTVSNFGGTWPRYFILKGVDYFTVATCKVTKQQDDEILVPAKECGSEMGKASCADLGGECITERDGYYLVSSICVTLGVILLVLIIKPVSNHLQKLPLSAWRVDHKKRQLTSTRGL